MADERFYRTHTATLSEIAKMMGWTESYARKLASVEQWGRIGWPRRYDLRDVAGHAARLKGPA